MRADIKTHTHACACARSQRLWERLTDHRERQRQRDRQTEQRERELAEGTVESHENRYVLPDRIFTYRLTNQIRDDTVNKGDEWDWPDKWGNTVNWRVKLAKTVQRGTHLTSHHAHPTGSGTTEAGTVEKRSRDTAQSSCRNKHHCHLSSVCALFLFKCSGTRYVCFRFFLFLFLFFTRFSRRLYV